MLNIWINPIKVYLKFGDLENCEQEKCVRQWHNQRQQIKNILYILAGD